MSQRLTIDLTKNPEVAQLVSDMEVGAAVKLETTIYSKDEQSLVLELEEADAGDGSKDDGDEAEPNAAAPSESDSAAMAVAMGKAKP